MIGCEIYKGDCLEELNKIPDKKVDLVLTDPPYGLTQCKWDSIIPLEPLWASLGRVLKENGVIVMTSCQPFTSFLVISNLKMFKYSLVWEKTTATGHLNARKRFMRAHEDILIFYNKQCKYNPQITSGHPLKSALRVNRGKASSECYGVQKSVTSYRSTCRYPRSVIKTSTDKQKSKLHPTQKPVALMEYLIKTFTDKGDVVLDFAMGSGTTGVACKRRDRYFIGIEINEAYFNIAKERVFND